MLRVVVTVALILGAGTVFGGLPSKVTLATTNWCPYACDQSAQGPGFIVEFMTALLRKRGVALEVKSYPWSRAIELAKAGKVDGLLTAAADEMDSLVPTTSATGTYNVCFFAAPKKEWQFSGVPSLKGVRLGIIADYSYGEPVDSYIKTKPDHLVVKHASDGLASLLEMLKAGRIDTTLDDENVVANVAAEHHLAMTQFRNAGCLGSTPFYTAFSPKLPWVKEMIAALDADLKKPETASLYKKYLNKYTGRK